MGMIDITPVMTSDTTPSPYIATASSVYGSGYHAYNAFDGKIETPYVTDNSTGWAQLDFSSKVSVNKIEFASSDQGWTTQYALIQGSNDNVNFENILEINERLDPSTVKIYDIETVSYRFLRVNVATSYSYTGFGYVKFLFDENLVNGNVSHTKAFHAQTLPMNTTNKILSKFNDSREGLLGMANDLDNYGDLYVVGRDGKSHLTKSGIKSEIIFDGDANLTNSQYKLSNNLNKYKQLIVYGNQIHKTTFINGGAETSITINVDDININNSYQYRLLMYGTGNTSHITFGFDSNISFKIIESYVNNTMISNQGITKIVGIY